MSVPSGFKFSILQTIVDGTVLSTWGQNTSGQLGLDNRISYSSPIQVGTTTNWKQLSVSSANLVGIKTDGTLWSCGSNGFGQLGLGNRIGYSSPIQVGSLTDWKQVALGPIGDHTVILKTNGSIWSCGYNIYGQLGHSQKTKVSTSTSSPIQVGSLTDWYNISDQTFSTNNSFAQYIKNDGTLWTWGVNTYGQLGNETTINYSSPVQIGSLTDWSKVVCGTYNTLAIKTDGSLWSWGYNNTGQLGNGTTINYSSPVQIGSLTNWSKIIGSYDLFASIKTDGSLWSWGYNGYGQLGNGTTNNYSSPVQIGALTDWSQIIIGYYSPY